MNITIYFEHNKLLIENVVKRQVDNIQYVVWYKEDEKMKHLVFNTSEVKYVIVDKNN